MMNEFNPDKVGDYLLDELVTIGLLESTDSLKMSVSSMMLMEAPKTATNYHTKGVDISWSDFKQVYSNYEMYPSAAKVLMQLGVPINGIQGDSITTELRRMAHHFKSNGQTINGMDIPSPKERANVFSKKAQVSRQKDDPTMDDIDPGSRNKRTKSTVIVDKINAQEILDGEFYANRTRIPKSRWAGWLKFWRREENSVKPNKFSWTGRHWGKSFIMGYQVDRQLFVEIWYNSLDSTFSIYDRNGVELGSPVETVQEAIRYLTVQVARIDKSDNEFFGHGVNNGVAQSMMRSLAQGLTADSSIKQREAILKGKQGAEDENYMQGRKDARNSIRKKQVRNEKWKRHAKAAATRIAREVIMNDKDKALNFNEFRKRMQDELKGAGDEIFSDAMDNIGQMWKDYQEELIKAASEPHDPHNPWDSRNQGKGQAYGAGSSHYGNYSGNTYDHGEDDDVIYQGQDSSGRPGSPVALPSGQEREQKKKQDQEEFEKEFTKRHGSGVKNALDKAKERLSKQEKELSKAETPEEREAALKRAREQLQKDIEAEGEADETPINKKGGLGNYYGSLKDRRNLKEGMFDNDDDGEFKQAMMVLDEPQDIDHNKVDAEVKGIRNMAERSPYTQAALKGRVMGEMFSTYNATRADDGMSTSRLARWATNMFFKNRKDKLILPTDKTPFWDAIKMGVKGQKFRADFVIGFSLADRVNVEIWYITEPSSEKDKWGTPSGMVSSFYVYDVTSKTVIRKYLPYYRNAVQVAYAKVGTTI